MSEKIEFHTTSPLLDVIPRPLPASQMLPQWFRQMPTHADDGATETVKRCPPFLEAMSCGYMIPLPADIKVTVTREGVRCETTGYSEPLAMLHTQEQFPGAPFPQMPVVKFRNLWIVKTPPGHSTLFLPPLNRFELPFVPLAGIVETDTYYRNVAFPCLCLLQPDTEVVLKRGTPLVQAIPFLRSEWTSSHTACQDEKLSDQQHDFERNPHMYKEGHWVRKSYA